MDQSKHTVRDTVLLLICGISLYIFWTRFMRGSAFKWTVEQPGYWNAVMEMAAAFAIYITILRLENIENHKKVIGCVIVLLGFAYLHAFFLPTIMVAIYFGMIWLLGYTICAYPCKKYDKSPPDLHFCIVSGMAGVILIVAIASAFGFGRPDQLRVLLPCLFFFLLLLQVPGLRRNLKSRERGKRILSSEPPGMAEAALVAFLFMTITLTICRANLGTDYDSLWYGYRSQYVLAPKGGIFDNAMLPACVYLYSKGIEVLALVFSGLSSWGFISGINIAFVVLTIHALYNTIKRIGGRLPALAVAACVSVVPSFMNMALTAKSDCSTIYLQILAVCYSLTGLRKKDPRLIVKAVCVLLLSYAFKPSSLLFSTTILAVLLLVAFPVIRHMKARHLWTILIGILPVCVLWFRTWYLMGVPCNSLLIGLWTRLGFTVREPYELVSSGTASLSSLLSMDFIRERMIRLVYIFLAPNKETLSHIQIAWWGPLIPLCGIVSVLSIVSQPVSVMRYMRQNAHYAFHTISFFLLTGMSIGTLLLLNRPDGNYYGLLCVLTVTQLLLEMIRRKEHMGNAPQILLSSLLLGNALLLLATSWSWGVGLTPIDLSRKGYYNHEKEYVIPRLHQEGLTEIYEELKSGETKHIMGMISDASVYFMLPVTGDTFYQQMTWAPVGVSSADHMLEYIKQAKVDGIIADRSFLDNDSLSREKLQTLAERGVLRLDRQTEIYILMKVNFNHPEPDEQVLSFLQVSTH